MPTTWIVPGRRPGAWSASPPRLAGAPPALTRTLPRRSSGQAGRARDSPPGWPVSVTLPVASTSDAGDHPVVERRDTAGDLQSPGRTAGGSTSTSLQHRRSHLK